MNDLAGRLEAEAAGFAGRVGYALANLSTGEQLSRNADDVFPTASAIKLPVLTAFHAFVERGEASWDDLAPIEAGYAPGGSGVLEHLTLPREISYRDAAWLMICVSDNLATNLLLRAMGLDGTNQLIREIIGEGIVVNKFAGFQPGAPVRSMGSATPGALGHYLGELAASRLPGSAATRDVALQQISRGAIPRYLPLDPYSATASLQVANKGGSLPGIRTDIALLRVGDTRMSMAFMIADATDTTGVFENEAERCIGRMARIAYDAWVATSGAQ